MAKSPDKKKKKKSSKKRKQEETEEKVENTTTEEVTPPKKKKSKKDKSAKKSKKKDKSPKKKKSKDEGEGTPKKKKKKKKDKKDKSAKKKKKDKSPKKKEKKEEDVVEEEKVEETKEEKVETTADDTPAEEGTKRLFLGNLSYQIDDDSCKDYFKDCGEIIDIHWLCSKDDGSFFGKGFVEFKTAAGAKKAMEKNGTDCMGRPIKMDWAESNRGAKKGGNKGGRVARPLSEKPEGCTTCFCGNLSFDIDDDKMKEFAKDCGEISQIRWLTDRDSGDFKGCGFIEFASTDAVDKFVALNGTNLMGRDIRIDYAKSRSGGGGGKSRGGGGGGGGAKPLSEKPEGCTTVFLGNLSFDIDDDKIKEIATKQGCGEPKSIRWLTDRESGEFKGCGFCEFHTTEDVDNFVKINGESVMGRNIRVDFAKARAPRE